MNALNIEGNSLRSDRRRLGFVLAELVVTTTTAATLAVMVLVALSSAGHHSKRLHCLENARGLTLALHLYATDNNELFPPNEDNNNRLEGWVAGDMTVAHEATNTIFLTDPAYAKLARYTGPEPSIYRCPADPSTVRIEGREYRRVRSVAMNQAIGTKRDGVSPVEGSWLNEGTYANNTAKSGPYRTYGRLSDLVAPPPDRLWVFADEDPSSINDGALALTLRSSPSTVGWIDRPASFHDLGCGFAFADGHSEIHRWKDGRTPLLPGAAPRSQQPNNPDLLWIMERTTARLRQ